ncbi:MAG: hypothetical protein EKK61_03355 [Rickettsiales bacterium]|nr:MAG: hypothetical protein EKK61_03355 [Rickettsiales bacterium]
MSDLNNDNKPERSSSINGLVWFLLAFPIGGLLGGFGGFLVQHKDEANKLIHKSGLIMLAVNLLLMFLCIIWRCFSKSEPNKKSLNLLIFCLISLLPAVLIPFFGTWGY